MLSAMRREDEEIRTLEYLSMMVRMRGHTHKEIDETLGWCRGTTGQVFKGRIQLKLRHILEILDVCEIPTAMFLENVFPGMRSGRPLWSAAGDEGERGFRSDRPPTLPPRRPAPSSPTDVQGMLNEIVARLPAFMALRPQRTAPLPSTPRPSSDATVKKALKAAKKAATKAVGKTPKGSAPAKPAPKRKG